MAKTQSLAAKTGTLTVPFQLPKLFTAPMEPVKARKISPYITFAHPKRADEWQKLVAKFGNVVEHDMYLVTDEYIVPLPVAKLGWICHRQFWAEANPAGEIVHVSWEEKPHPYKEHIESVALCYLEDRVIPCNLQLRTTKCNAGKVLSDALTAASDPVGWGSRSQAHKESVVVEQPFCRFYGLVTLGATRTSKSSGLPYRPTNCTTHPTGSTEWRLIAELSEREDCSKVMQAAADRFQYRIDEVSKKSSAVA